MPGVGERYPHLRVEPHAAPNKLSLSRGPRARHWELCPAPAATHGCGGGPRDRGGRSLWRRRRLQHFPPWPGAGGGGGGGGGWAGWAELRTPGPIPPGCRRRARAVRAAVTVAFSGWRAGAGSRNPCLGSWNGMTKVGAEMAQPAPGRPSPGRAPASDLLALAGCACVFLRLAGTPESRLQCLSLWGVSLSLSLRVSVTLYFLLWLSVNPRLYPLPESPFLYLHVSVSLVSVPLDSLELFLHPSRPRLPHPHAAARPCTCPTTSAALSEFSTVYLLPSKSTLSIPSPSPVLLPLFP